MPRTSEDRLAEIMASGGWLQPYVPPEDSEKISSVERLAGEFESHETQEKDLVDRYGEIERSSKSPFVKFLLRLIVADEKKHYEITHAMLSTLKGSLSWTQPKDAIQSDGDLEKEKEELLRITDEFIRLEKEGITEYKRLVQESEGYYNDLFPLLFRAMIHDTEKHVEILEFLRRTLKEA